MGDERQFAIVAWWPRDDDTEMPAYELDRMREETSWKLAERAQGANVARERVEVLKRELDDAAYRRGYPQVWKVHACEFYGPR